MRTPHTHPGDATRHRTRQAAARAFALTLLSSLSSLVVAQTDTTSNTLPDINPTTHPITQAQPLTEWLRAHAATQQSAYPLATAWSTPEEAARQAQTHRELVLQLQQTLRNPHLNPWLQWLQDQPATGRMALSAVQAEWLDANPQRNPLLQAGDTLTTQPQVGHVSLIWGDGQGCRLPHQPGAHPADYLLTTCKPAPVQHSTTPKKSG